MSRRGKRIGWGVAIAAALVLFSPLLLMAFLMGSNLVRALLSPTRDAAESQPTAANLAGTYVSLATTLALKADYTFEVTALPSYDMEGQKQSCEWNGLGRWTLYRNSLGLELTDPSRALGKINCLKGSQENSFVVLGQHPPYKLYFIIGDPDSGDGSEFIKVAH